MNKPNFNLKEIEKQTILRCLEYHQGHRIKTVKSLGISIKCLRNKLIRWNMQGYLKHRFKNTEMSTDREKYLKSLSKRTPEE